MGTGGITFMNVNDYFKYINMGLPEDIRRLKDAGYYDEAMRLMDIKAARPDTPEELKYCFLAWKEIFRRIPREYSLSKDDLFKQFKEKISDFTEEDFKKEEDDGLLRWIFLRGEKRYFKSSVRTVLKTDLEMAGRAGLDTSDPDKLLNEAIEICKKEGRISKNIRYTHSLKVRDDLFKPGMKVRVHIPIPAECIEQTNIKIESTFPENAVIGKANSEARCVYFEETLNENHEFSVTYSYTFTNVYKDCYGEVGGSSSGEYDPGEEFLAEEGPHIVFSPIIRTLAAKIGEGCRDKGVLAKRVYDYLTFNLKYTFTPNYILLPDIVEDGALFMRGDCGVMALLFITICRCLGVGARWQSSRTMEPSGSGQHDWAEAFLPDFGWVPVDVSYGVAAHRYGNEERRRFYFGNLDPYRMVANSKFQADLEPAKTFFRNDPYDNQDGEIESDISGLREDDIVERGEVIV